MRLRGHALAVIVAAACSQPAALPPTAQIVLYFDTDAPLPPPPGTAPGPEDPPALFDSLRVDVLGPDADAPCEGCSREFAVDTGMFRATEKAKKASIGIPLKAGVQGYRVRARLFARRWLVWCEASGDTGCAKVPHPNAAIDVTAPLTATQADTISEWTLRLRTEWIGAAKTIELGSDDYHQGSPSGSLVSTWPGARRMPCSDRPRADEACVPGGAYVHGHPVADPSPRLVVLSPFFIKTSEVTVAEFKASGVGGAGINGAPPTYDLCSMPAGTPTDSEGRTAVNCVGIYAARAFCKVWGGGLPTEAQWQYVASGLLGHLYPWGDDDPGCHDAVWGHPTPYPSLNSPLSSCLPVISVPPPTNRLDLRLRDWIELPAPDGAVRVYDLAGSLREFVADSWVATWSSPYWTAPGPLVDPMYTEPGGQAALKGGWYAAAADAAAVTNGWALGGQGNIAFGIRCARPDTP
jgi:formylglycine-generating enzyme required for sulfatase activity